MATITIKGQTYSTKKTNLYKQGAIYGSLSLNPQVVEIIENEQDLQNLVDTSSVQTPITPTPQRDTLKPIPQNEVDSMKTILDCISLAADIYKYRVEGQK